MLETVFVVVVYEIKTVFTLVVTVVVLTGFCCSEMTWDLRLEMLCP